MSDFKEGGFQRDALFFEDGFVGFDGDDGGFVAFLPAGGVFLFAFGQVIGEGLGIAVTKVADEIIGGGGDDADVRGEGFEGVIERGVRIRGIVVLFGVAGLFGGVGDEGGTCPPWWSPIAVASTAWRGLRPAGTVGMPGPAPQGWRPG